MFMDISTTMRHMYNVAYSINVAHLGYSSSTIYPKPMSSLDAFSQRVRTFDAFPKVGSENKERSKRGGYSTILTIFCGLLILWAEVGGYLGGYVDKQFAVDAAIKESLQINIDILVAMPCEFLRTNTVDITNDRYLAGELLNFEGMSFMTPEHFNIDSTYQAQQDQDLDTIMQDSLKAEFKLTATKFNQKAPACHIFGSIPVNHVRGEFHIVGKGFSYREPAHVPYESLNFSHVIQEFSYGEFYPYINNPLDFTGRTTKENLQAFKYFTNIVPTMYEKLGIEVDTYQYSLNELHKTYKLNDFGKLNGIPGIFFKYDFEPIKLFISEKRIGFIQFVARLGTIIGGLLIAGGYLLRLYEKLLVVLFGQKFAKKDTEKKDGGLLDS